MTLPGLRFTIVREICPFTALYPVWAVFVGSTRGNIGEDIGIQRGILGVSISVPSFTFFTKLN